MWVHFLAYYLTFMGRNLENRKNMTPIQIIMNSVGLNSMNIVHNVGIINDNFAMNNILIELY